MVHFLDLEEWQPEALTRQLGPVRLLAVTDTESGSDWMWGIERSRDEVEFLGTAADHLAACAAAEAHAATIG